jgi:hypothetical protein
MICSWSHEGLQGISVEGSQVSPPFSERQTCMLAQSRPMSLLFIVRATKSAVP